jgi:ABC-type Fe3+/spermidine/putrescine transport system ATPase subunit
MGPSGSGKSTLMHCLAGLDTATEGQVWLGDTELTSLRDDQLTTLRRQRIGFVFQAFNLLPVLDALENITLPMQLAGQRPDRAWLDAVIARLGLRERLGHRPHELSGGQQQRVAIARALVKRPAVLLLDEPLSSLDLRLRVQMQRVLKHIQQESGTTFVYVTHDQTEALAMSDRIAIMHAGRIEQIDAPADVYGRPRTRFAATFVGETNIFDGAVDSGGAFVSDGLTLHVPGRGVAALVRPERVALAPSLDVRPGWNVFDGVVDDVVFHGSNVHYRVRLPNGRELVASRPNDASVGVGSGDRVQVGWDAGSAVMLEE